MWPSAVAEHLGLRRERGPLTGQRHPAPDPERHVHDDRCEEPSAAMGPSTLGHAVGIVATARSNRPADLQGRHDQRTRTSSAGMW